jgi:prevent-host-death family protein
LGQLIDLFEPQPRLTAAFNSVQSVRIETKGRTVSKSKVYGLEQARAQLPLIAAEAEAGYSSEITRHGKPVAMVVPVKHWQAQQGRAVKVDGILALRGSGAGLWPKGGSKETALLRNEWQD